MGLLGVSHSQCNNFRHVENPASALFRESLFFLENLVLVVICEKERIIGVVVVEFMVRPNRDMHPRAQSAVFNGGCIANIGNEAGTYSAIVEDSCAF